MSKLYLVGRFGRYAPRTPAEITIASQQAKKRAREKVLRNQVWPCKNMCGASGLLQFSGCCCEACEKQWQAKVESGEVWLQARCLRKRCSAMCTVESAPFCSTACDEKFHGKP